MCVHCESSFLYSTVLPVHCHLQQGPPSPGFRLPNPAAIPAPDPISTIGMKSVTHPLDEYIPLTGPLGCSILRFRKSRRLWSDVSRREIRDCIHRTCKGNPGRAAHGPGAGAAFLVAGAG